MLLDGLGIGESPRWHEDRLWFCNWGTDQIVAVDIEGNSEVVLHDAAVAPHSIDWLPDGRLLIVPGNADCTARLLQQDAHGSLTPYGRLDRLPSGFNEITTDGRGNVYVNGADFNFLAFIEQAMKDMASGDQTPLHERPDFVPGYIALITPDGEARQVADDIAFPNGMAITPDNRTLIISESFTGALTAFDVADDGGLSNRRVFADGLGPDGICIDADGAVWTSQGQRDCVRVTEGGQILTRVEIDRDPFACMLGGPDGQTLFIMAAVWNPANPFGGPRTGQVLIIDAPAPHTGWP
ncbi:SMP-30/gluconolactonase/LRE family protein [Pseudonocardia lacus]|uniref:SMP-30/gluconolactonase/LRE family protein n=1 Tax=Pseudonocardia lacus TaxID=2835865 RepID=UPI0027E36B7F|nr:SMP-30/gluconolactonase/LRE family protein [Pseudonocardia lacus]